MILLNRQDMKNLNRQDAKSAKKKRKDKKDQIKMDDRLPQRERTRGTYCRLFMVLSSCLLLALLASWRFNLFASSAQQDATRPYQLQVVLHVAEHRLLTDVFRDRVGRELRDGLQASLGELAKVEVVRDHPKLEEVLDRGLQRTLDGWKERSEVKTHFVLIDFSGTHYEIQARQHDGLTGQASPVVRRDRTRDREFVARVASLLVDRDFGLVGTVAGPAPGPSDQETFKVVLNGGALDVPMERWVKKGDVFAVVPVPPGGGAVQALPFALMQVVDTPVATNRDGACVCRFYHRHKVGNIAGYRCLKLATTKAPVRLRLSQLKPDSSTAALPEPLMIQVRRSGFDKAVAIEYEQSTDPAGVFETVKRGGENVLFENVAFVTILKDRTECARVPLAIVDDRQVSLAVPITNDPNALLAERRDTWIRNVYESYLVQVSIFQEVNKLSGKAETRAQAMQQAEAGARRAKDDHSRLMTERAELLTEVQKPGVKQPDLTQGDKFLKDLKAGEEKLQEHVDRMKKIEGEENDPKRKEWLRLAAEGNRLENELEYAKAIACYRQVLKDGYDNDMLLKRVEKLEKLWNTDDANLKAARAFIYDEWPGLDTPDLLKRMGDAEKAFDACRTAKDLIGPQKMLKAADAHVARLSKELGALSEVNIDDEKPIKVIKDLTPRLGELIKSIDKFLKNVAGEK